MTIQTTTPTAPSYREESYVTYPCSAAVTKNRLVTFASGTVAHAAHTDRALGVAQNSVFNVGDMVTVRLLNSDGTIIMTADGVIAAAPTLVFGCDNGKINDTDPGSGKKVGLALGAASADGDLVEVIPFLAQS